MVLDESDRQAIAARTRQIEQRTGAQVVLTVVRRARRYPEAQLLAGGTMLVLGGVAAALAAAAYGVPPLVGLAAMVLLPVLGALAALLLPGLEPALVARTAREEAVRDRARALFIDQGVHATRDRVGVLVLVSLLERRVEVVPDVGLAARVPPSAWSDLLAAMRPGLTEGRLAAAFADGLEALERALGAAGLRPVPGGNELPQELVVEPGGRP